MKKNEQFEIEITGMAENGEGVGRVDGMAVFIPYTIVGEVVRTHIIKVTKNYAVGKPMEVIKPSVHRIDSPCPYFYHCGGCQLWHMEYAEELRYKTQKVRECIKRIGGIDVLPSAILGAESRCHYRNKSLFPVTPDGIGMYAGRSHRLVEINHCLIQDKSTELMISLVRQWMDEYGILPYDEERCTGQIRHIYFRKTDEGIMFCLVAARKQIPHLDALVDLFLGKMKNICSISINYNFQKTNVILGKEFQWLWGNKTLCDHLGEVTFSISPLSFYQINKTQMKKLYEKIREYADLSGTETVWDIYCGIGTIGQYLARDCARVIGIEIVEDAVKNAIENAEKNELTNTKYFCGAAERIVSKIMQTNKRPDIVIVDPPRKGCDTALLDTIVQIIPKKIIYVSCKPSTLARDLKYLSAHGYTAKSVTPVDMFPATAHVETVVLMSKTDK